MLEIKNLSVSIQDKIILENINLEIKSGQVMVLFGPNGSGKSTLLKTIMGFSGYEKKSGQIIFKGKNIDSLSIEERVKLGLGMMYQNPPKVRGVKLLEVAQFLSKDKKNIEELSEKLSLKEHLNREINLGFSGGEIKRAELFQILLQDPELLFLDEPESGVDLENISLMGGILNNYLRKQNKSALIITHTGYILDYIKADSGCVMIEGRLWCMGSPKEIFESIRKKGYEKCKVCHAPERIE